MAAIEFTSNPLFGETDAVTEPLAINERGSTSSASAESGILNKSLPLPLNEPLKSPKNLLAYLISCYSVGYI